MSFPLRKKGVSKTDFKGCTTWAATQGPTLGFMLRWHPVDILSSLGTRRSAFSFYIGSHSYAPGPGGLGQSKKSGVGRAGPPAVLLLLSMLPHSPAPNLASHARNFKSGKRAKEKFVMGTVLLPPSAPCALSLSLSLS